jgi:hypothetical protein
MLMIHVYIVLSNEDYFVLFYSKILVLFCMSSKDQTINSYFIVIPVISFVKLEMYHA